MDLPLLETMWEIWDFDPGLCAVVVQRKEGLVDYLKLETMA